MLITLAVAIILAPGQPHDGDSLRLTTGEKIRLYAEDAPEMKGSPACRGWKAKYHNCDYDAAKRSRAALMVLLAGKTLTMDRLGVDPYKRTIGRVYANGVDVSCYMVRNSWAVERYGKLIDCPASLPPAR